MKLESYQLLCGMVLPNTILPTIALAMSPMADSARFIRTEM